LPPHKPDKDQRRIVPNEIKNRVDEPTESPHVRRSYSAPTAGI